MNINRYSISVLFVRRRKINSNTINHHLSTNILNINNRVRKLENAKSEILYLVGRYSNNRTFVTQVLGYFIKYISLLISIYFQCVLYLNSPRTKVFFFSYINPCIFLVDQCSSRKLIIYRRLGGTYRYY